VLPWQQLGESQALPGQHESPALPQVTQTPLLQVVRAAVHAPALGFAPQQGRPGPPQVPQVPALHLSPPMLEQLAPAARQMPEMQHPPPSQVLAAQQGSPGWPQAGAPLPPVPRAPPTAARPTVPAMPPPPRPAASASWMLTSVSLPCEASPLPPPGLDPPHASGPAAPTSENTRKPMPLHITRVPLRPAMLHPRRWKIHGRQWAVPGQTTTRTVSDTPGFRWMRAERLPPSAAGRAEVGEAGGAWVMLRR
jgi:hypothetical protein